MPDLRETFCSATQTLSIDLGLATPGWADEASGGHESSVALRDTITGIAGDTLVRVAFTRPKARDADHVRAHARRTRRRAARPTVERAARDAG